ncbi:hypothetical protein E5Q_06237 [Mixia osmundae IAM 14324]|uniref:Uncharacterized protein n=1 Tax=Mixia osmundae (strain CBS 9802 / IAM 14324 / JCM 22182 / KY 12970) TaxID=764103 RepID=G7E8R8_MIXOS|nr:hypothetical protein E5Q_06237 [Mixia osmundae IAM 14324]
MAQQDWQRQHAQRHGAMSPPQGVVSPPPGNRGQPQQRQATPSLAPGQQAFRPPSQNQQRPMQAQQRPGMPMQPSQSATGTQQQPPRPPQGVPQSNGMNARQPSYPAQPGQNAFLGAPQHVQARSPSPVQQPLYGANVVNQQLSNAMAQTSIASTSEPQQYPANDMLAGPARTKRSQRAYHVQEDQAEPQQQYGQQAFEQQLRQQQMQQQQQQYQQQQFQQQPVHQPPVANQSMQHPYANAPPPGPQPTGMAMQHEEPVYQQQEDPLQPQIPQPPHSAGQRLNGPRTRIDPNSIPSPVAVQAADQRLFEQEPFLTAGRGAVPLSSTDFLAIDQGNCNPRFLRLTTYSIPSSDDIAQSAQMPLAMVLQPFARLKVEEGEVPLVDFGEVGPPRCSGCRGYINPWCVFIEGGGKYICNLCGAPTVVPPEYFAHLDMSGRRVDQDERAELARGSIDFVAPREYWVQNGAPSEDLPPRQPEPIRMIFAIDVSWNAMKTGMVREVAEALKMMFYGRAAEDGEVTADQQQAAAQTSLAPGTRIAIMTFDRAVQFYNLLEGLEQPQMLVVPDIDDIFMPLNQGFFVDPEASRPAITALLDSLPDLFAQTATVEAAIGAPIQASLHALKSFGGQVTLFQTILPTVGPGALKTREDQKLYGTDKEKALFSPQDPWYRQIGEECADCGIGINLFLFPSQYIDVATLSVLPGLTGGDLQFFTRFDPVRDGPRLRAQVLRIAQRETGYSVTMRIRCSNGLRVANHHGNFFQRNVTDLEFGCLDADKTISALIQHEGGRLDESKDAHFQCAVLYTSATGQRRVRCHNLSVPITSLLANVFRYADVDTTLAYVAKECVFNAATKALRDIREQLTDTCVKILLAYRKHCASSTSPGQLILPESFKLLPVYTMALTKSKAIKGGAVISDVRAYYMRMLRSIGVTNLVELLYPRMLSIHDLPADAGFPDESGKLVVPELIRTSYARLVPHGAYIIENGEVAILWLGHAVSPQILTDLYGVESLEDLDIRMSVLPRLPTRLSEQVRNLIKHAEARRQGMHLPVLIARQNMDGLEMEFGNMLVEDQNNDAMSYVDYLCQVHKNIQGILVGAAKASAANDDSAASLWKSLY